MLVVESLPWKDEWPLVVYAERHIRNGQPHLQEHLLIERLHLEHHTHVLQGGVYISKPSLRDPSHPYGRAPPFYEAKGGHRFTKQMSSSFFIISQSIS